MIENELEIPPGLLSSVVGQIRETGGRQVFKSYVCRCGEHVDPHWHPAQGLAQSIFDSIDVDAE